VWPQCWLCAVCAVGHVGCCVGEGGTLWGKAYHHLGKRNMSHTHTRQEQHHTTHDTNNTTNDHTKKHPPHLTTIEGGAGTVRPVPSVPSLRRRGATGALQLRSKRYGHPIWHMRHDNGRPVRHVPAKEEKLKVDALGVLTISRGCFERCCNNKNPPHTVLTLVSGGFETIGTLLRAPHTHTHTRQEQHHTTHDKNNTTNDHAKTHPPHLTTIEVARGRCVPPPISG